MTLPTYLGIDNDKNAWMLVQRSEGKTVFLRRFQNTIDGLDDLAKYIKSGCKKPRICIKSSGRATFDLLKYLYGIPDIEVMFVSQAGLKQYQTSLPNSIRKSSKVAYGEAEILANCAERMI